ncbi:GFA family protein [Limimaricola sp.]|uniref:GFA family protein n=1 Tax=Limimaricola sp. TaxID=2211665 RepID=UPI004058B010
MMLTGECHCGALRWSFDGLPGSGTVCNCSVCHRYGTIWAYGHEGEEIRLSGPSRAYRWGDRGLGFHFCAECGCVGYWRAVSASPEGRRRVAVNLRLAPPGAVDTIPLRRFDGRGAFERMPPDGRCLADLWL